MDLHKYNTLKCIIYMQFFKLPHIDRTAKLLLCALTGTLLKKERFSKNP